MLSQHRNEIQKTVDTIQYWTAKDRHAENSYYMMFILGEPIGGLAGRYRARHRARHSRQISQLMDNQAS